MPKGRLLRVRARIENVTAIAVEETGWWGWTDIARVLDGIRSALRGLEIITVR